MTITANDLRFMASQRLNDDTDGGGLPTGTSITSGVENNIFPDIGTLDRIGGRLQLRKIYPSVLSVNQDTYIGAHVIIDDEPDDTNVDVFMYLYGDLGTVRSDVTMQSKLASKTPDDLQYGIYTGDNIDHGATGGTELWVNYTSPVVQPDPTTLAAGDWIYTDADHQPQQIISISPIVLTGNGGTISKIIIGRPNPGPVTKIFVPTKVDPLGLRSCSSLSAAAPAGQQYVDPAKIQIHLVTQPVASFNFDMFHANDILIISETTKQAAANVGTGTINTGKTNLARVRIIGADGNVIGRYDVGATQPSGTGATVDFAAGTINVTSTSGWSQPAVVEYRVEDMRICTGVDRALKRVYLNKVLSRNFTTAAKVSSAAVYGDVQARVHDTFTINTFVDGWSDSIPPARQPADGAYNAPLFPIGITNAGGVKERWAIVFTSSTTFTVRGEKLGFVVVGGSTATDVAPINPATNQPYFTLNHLGWSAGWSAGQVLRFNTDGGNFPLWIGRNIQPSDPVDIVDSVSLQMRGDVDAS